MDSESSELMRAYVTIRGDLSGLERDTAKARQIVDGKLASPVKITVNGEPIVQAGRAADVAAAKIKGVVNIDASKLDRSMSWIDQAFRNMSRSAGELDGKLSGMAENSMRNVARGYDQIAAKVRSVAGEARRAMSAVSGGGINAPGGTGQNVVHTRSGGFMRSAAGSFLGGVGARFMPGGGGPSNPPPPATGGGSSHHAVPPWAVQVVGGVRTPPPPSLFSRGMFAAESALRTPIPMPPAGLALGAAGAVGAAGTFAAAGAGAAAAGFGKVVKDGLPGIEDEKKYIRIFDALLKDTEKAKQLFTEMAKIDLEVPIDLPNLLQSTQKLAQAGLTASEIPEKMRIIMDAAASSTEGALGGTQRIVQMISKIKSSGVLEMEDLKSLSSMGLPIAEIVQEKFRMNIRELAAATRSGKVEIQKVMDGMFDGLESRFKGNIGIEIETIAGQIELLKGRYSAFAGEVARPLFDPLLDGLKSVNDYLSSSDFEAFAEGLKTVTREAAETAKVLAKIYGGDGESMGIGAAIGGAAGGAARAGGETIRGMALLSDAGSKTEVGRAFAEDPLLSPLFGTPVNMAAGLFADPNTDQSGVGPKVIGGIDRSLSQEQRFDATPEQKSRRERMEQIREGIAKREQVFQGLSGALIADSDREAIQKNIDAGKREMMMLRREEEAEFESFRNRERSTSTLYGLGVAGGMASNYGRNLLGAAGSMLGRGVGALGEATGIASLEDAGNLASRGMDIAGQLRNRDVIQRRNEREKQEELLRQKSIKERAEQTVAQFQSNEDGGDPRLTEVLQKSKFAVSMRRNEDGQMVPSVALKELFQDVRASTQTTGLGGLNTLMQSSIDAAQARKFQADQKKLLEEVVKKLQEQINLAVADENKTDTAVVAPG